MPAIVLVGLLPLVYGCPNMCIQSQESPSTEGNCEPGIGGEKCVQQIQNVALTSTYTRGEDFLPSTMKIDLDWCPDAECSPSVTTGRALHVIFMLDEEAVPNADPIVFIANCQNRKVVETVENVAQIIIQEAPNLSDENVICGGNDVLNAFAKWEICPPDAFPD